MLHRQEHYTEASLSCRFDIHVHYLRIYISLEWLCPVVYCNSHLDLSGKCCTALTPSGSTLPVLHFKEQKVLCVHKRNPLFNVAPKWMLVLSIPFCLTSLIQRFFLFFTAIKNKREKWAVIPDIKQTTLRSCFEKLYCHLSVQSQQSSLDFRASPPLYLLSSHFAGSRGRSCFLKEAVALKEADKAPLQTSFVLF